MENLAADRNQPRLNSSNPSNNEGMGEERPEVTSLDSKA